MHFTKRIVVGVLTILLLFQHPVRALDAYYESYTYNSRGEAIPAPAAYTVAGTISGQSAGTSAFSNPGDLFADTQNGLVYLADTGNNRIVVLDSAYRFVRAYTGTVNAADGIQDFVEPKGIFVGSNGSIYVCDLGNRRVVKMDQNGVCQALYRRPDSELLDKSLEFQPHTVVADQEGNVYVLAVGVYNGFIKYGKDGNFKGFFGGNRVEVTAAVVFKQMMKKIMTQQQVESSARILPIEYSNAFIDPNNFIYTVSAQSETATNQMKKLNAKGANVFRVDNTGSLYDKTRFGDLEMVAGAAVGNRFVAVDVSPDNMITLLDETRGHLFQYDSTGTLLFIFGKKGNGKDSFQQPADVAWFNGKYLVLDSQKNRITLFEETAFAVNVKKALTLYTAGDYGGSVNVCREILKLDANCNIAYISMGRALMQQGSYKEAMVYLKKGDDRAAYSEAFRGYRMQFVRENFVWLLILLIVVVIAVRFAYRGVRSWLGYPVKKKRLIYR